MFAFFHTYTSLLKSFISESFEVNKDSHRINVLGVNLDKGKMRDHYASGNII